MVRYCPLAPRLWYPWVKVNQEISTLLYFENFALFETYWKTCTSQRCTFIMVEYGANSIRLSFTGTYKIIRIHCCLQTIAVGNDILWNAFLSVTIIFYRFLGAYKYNGLYIGLHKRFRIFFRLLTVIAKFVFSKCCELHYLLIQRLSYLVGLSARFELFYLDIILSSPY